jgi:hypothetical protein
MRRDELWLAGLGAFGLVVESLQNRREIVTVQWSASHSIAPEAFAAAFASCVLFAITRRG